MKRKYEIGGVLAEMTDAQASRWNSGSVSDSDLSNVKVTIPEPQNQHRVITLRRAVSFTMEPEVSRMLDCQPANLTN